MKRGNSNQKVEQTIRQRSYRGFFISSLLTAGIAALMFWPPVFSARQMAMAQAVHGSPMGGSDANAPIHGDLISPLPTPAAVTAPVPSAPVATAPVTNTATADSAKSPAGEPAHNSKDNSYQEVGFDRLGAYPFQVSDEMVSGAADKLSTSDTINHQIPADIKALNEKQISIKGFMLPLMVRHAQVSEFLLLRNQMMCCYGIVPKMNEWVVVNMAGRGVKSVMDRPITVSGTLRVGEIRENGSLVGVYQLNGDKLEAPEVQ